MKVTDDLGHADPLEELFRDIFTHASLRQVGVFSNKLLLGAIAVALAFAAALVYLPVMHSLFGTASLSPGQLAIVAPFPFIVWGADKIRRALVRRHGRLWRWPPRAR